MAGLEVSMTKKQRAIKRLWATALRSGKYPQGRQCLRLVKVTGDEYCCLAVLCELATEAGVLPLPKLDGRIYVYADNDTALLPAIVQKWAGLATSTGKFCSGSLVKLNDELNTFTEIADVIDAEPKGLFV
jgi:hypothetical protein